MKQKARCSACGKKYIYRKGRIVEHNNAKTNARCDGSEASVEVTMKK